MASFDRSRSLSSMMIWKQRGAFLHFSRGIAQAIDALIKEGPVNLMGTTHKNYFCSPAGTGNDAFSLPGVIFCASR